MNSERDDALRIVSDMNARVWSALKNALEELSEDEIQWRPLPQANSINLIVRHLRIEAEWHLHSLESGAPMPTVATSPSQEAPLDFEANFKELEECYTRLLHVLRTIPLNTLRERSAAAYGKAGESEDRRYLLGYHQATHVAMHCGQIRMIRNLYRKTRGEPARFFPENPTYPSAPQ